LTVRVAACGFCEELTTITTYFSHAARAGELQDFVRADAATSAERASVQGHQLTPGEPGIRLSGGMFKGARGNEQAKSATDLLRLLVRRPLPDAEDDELRGLDRSHANQTDQAAVVEVVLGHRGSVASHKERLLGSRAEEGAGLPLGQQE